MQFLIRISRGSRFPRNARQGALIAGLGVTVTAEQEAEVWKIIGRLQKDLETIN